jgi:cation diffusion facilitator CzcD-associated flavoprotein CzcO
MIVVVGAGPAGLALAYELQRRGLNYQVLERHAVGHAWSQHYDGLRLHTLKQVSALPGLLMPEYYPDFPSRAQFLAYLQGYATHFKLRIAESVELLRADTDGREWRLATSRGLMRASILVMATGIWSAPVRPDISGEREFGGALLHSSDYRNPSPFRGRRVLVIGAGNSGTEIALDLAEQRVEVALSVRGGVAFGPRPRSAAAMRFVAWLLRTVPAPLAEGLLRRRDFRHLGLPLPSGSPLDHYPVVGYELPEAVAAGRVSVFGAVERLAPGMVHFAGGRAVPFDAIILATGYRPALGPVAHLLDVDERGRPLLDAYGRALRAPRLVCVGYTYPTTEGWLQAIGRVARTAVEGMTGSVTDDTDPRQLAVGG